MKRKVMIGVVFLIGMVIFFYPIVSNWLSTKDHYTVMSEHNEALEKMTQEQKHAEKVKAEEYNASLNESEIPISDPFAEGAPEAASEGYFNVLDIGETMGSIEIPSLKVNLPIYHGVSDDVLQQGVGHMSNSSFPIGGAGTHTALTGHRGLPSSKLFRDLDKISEGEVFYIHSLDETLAYEVDDIQIVLPSETNWLKIDDDEDYVTLITCEPYMINTHRLLVRGERIDYEEAIPVSATTDLPNKEKMFSLSLFLIGIMGTIVLLYIYLRQRYLGRGELYEKK